MAKRRFVLPYVSLMGTGDPSNPLIGDGSGQSTTDEEAMEFEMWAVLFDEYDGDTSDGPGTWNDYIWWWYEHGFSPEEFLELNGTELPKDPRP